MQSYFYIEMNHSEIETLFKNGSTNQKAFINTAIAFNAVDEVFNILEELINDEILTPRGTVYDLRGNINGGVLFLSDKEGIKELDINNYLIYEVVENLYLCIQ